MIYFLIFFEKSVFQLPILTALLQRNNTTTVLINNNAL